MTGVKVKPTGRPHPFVPDRDTPPDHRGLYLCARIRGVGCRRRMPTTTPRTSTRRRHGHAERPVKGTDTDA